MSTTIDWSSGLYSRLFALARQVGRTENDLLEEAILNYLEDFEDIQEAQERLANPPALYLTLEEVE